MKKKKFFLFSSLRILDPYLLFKSCSPLAPPSGLQTSYQPAQELILSIPCRKKPLSDNMKVESHLLYQKQQQFERISAPFQCNEFFFVMHFYCDKIHITFSVNNYIHNSGQPLPYLVPVDVHYFKRNSAPVSSQSFPIHFSTKPRK